MFTNVAMNSDHNSPFIIHNSSGDLHHAYLIEGNVEANKQALFAFLREQIGFEPVGNPDFFFMDTGEEPFGVNDAHELKEQQSHTGVGDRKVFVVQTNRLTREAQNALLKTFEEPTVHTHIFILIPHAAHILPTLRSRVMLISETVESVSAVEPKEFLSLDSAKRLNAAQAFIKNKDKEGARVFLDALEKELVNSGLYKTKREHQQALTIILDGKQYLSQRSPSVKMILENVALQTPQVNAHK